MATLKSAGQKELAFSVAVVTLDASVDAPEILLAKIDVEGMECEVIEGAKRTLYRTRFLIVEANDREDLARIREALGAGWRFRKVGYRDYLFQAS